jgi:hypothetical protein
VKILVSRTHTVRPANYESVVLRASVEIDTENKADEEFADPDMTYTDVGESLSAALDELLDTDVDRTLRLGGEHIEETHLWDFYEKE